MSSRAIAGARRRLRGASAVGISLLAAWSVVALALAGPMWRVLFVVALFGAAAMFWSRHATEFLLATLAFTAPIAITKTIVVGAGIFAPALELTLVDLCLLVLLPIWLWHRRQRRQATRTGLAPMLLYFAWAWCTVLWADVPSNGVAAAMSLSRFLVLFVVVSDLVDSPERLHVVLVSAAVGFAVQLAIVAAQLGTRSSLLVQGSKGADIGLTLSFGATDVFRPSGLLLHPNNLASYLLLVLPILGIIVLLGEGYVGRRQWWTSCVLLAGGSVALALTMSRGGWISAVLGASFVYVVSYRARLIKGRQLFTLPLFTVVVAACVAVMYPPVVWRLTSSDQASKQSRLLLIDQAKEIIRDYPIAGAGLASYNVATFDHVPSEYAGVDSVTRHTLLTVPVHNHYLWLWGERGVFGVVFLLSIHATFLLALFRKRRWRDRMHHAVGIALSAGAFAHLSMYAFEPFSVDSRWITLWVAFALLSAVLRLEEPTGSVAARSPVARDPFSFGFSRWTARSSASI